MSTSHPARSAPPTPYIVLPAWVLVLLMGVGTVTAGDGAGPLPPLTAKAGACGDGDLGGPAYLYLGAQTCIPPSAGLVSWWPGAGSAEDLVGTSNGTLIGDATFGPGLVDQAFSLDGSFDWVDFGSDATYNFGTSDFTVMLWVKFNTLDDVQVLFEKWDDGPGFEGNERAGWSLAKLDE